MRKKQMQEHKANRNWINRTPLTVIDAGFLHFCLEYRLVEVCGQEIELTASEFEMFYTDGNYEFFIIFSKYLRHFAPKMNYIAEGYFFC